MERADLNDGIVDGPLVGFRIEEGTRSSFAQRSAFVLIGLLMTTSLAIAVAGLALSLGLFEPDVILSSQAANPRGYVYGGAVHQGAGFWASNKPPLPYPRFDHAAITVGDIVFLLGGQNYSRSVLSDNHAFDMLREEYNLSKAPMPVPRCRFAATAVGHHIYVIGGVTGRWDGDAMATVDLYDASADSWADPGTVPPMSIARSDLAATTFEGQLYAIGGYGRGADKTNTGSLLEVYSPATRTWRTLADMPTPRTNLMAIAFRGRIWAMGGWNDNDETRGPGGDFQAATEAFSPSSNSWETYADMMTRKAFSSVVSYRGQILSIGGRTWSQDFKACRFRPEQVCKAGNEPTHDTISFLPDIDPPSIADSSGPGGFISEAGNRHARGVWVSHAPMPGARSDFAAAASETAQAVFVFGGESTDTGVLDLVTAFYDTYHPHVFMHYKIGHGWW